MTGLGDLVPREMQVSALKKIFDYNVMKFAGGSMGAVSGISPDGKLIMLKNNQQVDEVWGGHDGPCWADVEPRDERAGIPYVVGLVSYQLRNVRLLVPHSGGLGH